MGMRVIDKRNPDFYWIEHELFRSSPDGSTWASLLQPDGIAVYSCIVSHTNKAGQSYPSYSTIARECGVSRRNVIRYVKRLSDMGFITLKGQSAKRTNIIQVEPKNRWKLYPARSSMNRPKTGSNGDTQSPLMVTHSHPHSDTQSPLMVTHSHPHGDTQSPEVKPVSKKNKVEPSSSSNITQPAQSEQTKKDNDDDDDDVAPLNIILQSFGRTERLTLPLLKEIKKLYGVTREDVIKAVELLAPNEAIKNVIGVIKGRRNASGGYDSGCFAEGVCILGALSTSRPERAARPKSKVQEGIDVINEWLVNQGETPLEVDR